MSHTTRRQSRNPSPDISRRAAAAVIRLGRGAMVLNPVIRNLLLTARKVEDRRFFCPAALILALGAGCLATTAALGDSPERRWWEPGEGSPMPATISYPNELGLFTLLNAGGAFDTRGHPFFEPLGTNGRACVTCHQPADAMSAKDTSAWTAFIV